MKKINFDDPYLKKNLLDDSDELYNIENHELFIHDLYYNIDFSYNKILIREIKKKHSSYKSQDKLKKKYDEEQHITYDELLKKLYDCNLRCYYCSEKLYLIHKNKKEYLQWSLERFDNNLGHYNSNTCISCLGCNLQRRNDNHEYFKESKQMTKHKIKTFNIIKKENNT